MINLRLTKSPKSRKLRQSMRLELLLHTGNQIALVKPQNSLLRATVLTASPSTHRQKITFAKLDSYYRQETNRFDRCFREKNKSSQYEPKELKWSKGCQTWKALKSHSITTSLSIVINNLPLPILTQSKPCMTRDLIRSRLGLKAIAPILGISSSRHSIEILL